MTSGPNLAVIIGAVLGTVVGIIALSAMALVYLMHRAHVASSQISSPTLSLKTSGISDKARRTQLAHVSVVFGSSQHASIPTPDSSKWL